MKIINFTGRSYVDLPWTAKASSTQNFSEMDLIERKYVLELKKAVENLAKKAPENDVINIKFRRQDQGKPYSIHFPEDKAPVGSIRTGYSYYKDGKKDNLLISGSESFNVKDNKLLSENEPQVTINSIIEHLKRAISQ